MSATPRLRWEPAAAILCGALCFVPLIRVPAAALLLCLLPGIAICRHRLGETSPVRVLILGSLISLCAVPAVVIPAALLAGRPTPLMAVVLSCALTLASCFRPGPPRTPAPLPKIAWLHLGLIVLVAIGLQIGIEVAMHPSAETIRWTGLPDFMFFNGIYTQLELHTPPMDPEQGSELLVHNWLYHFQFMLLKMTGGLSIFAMQRLVSVWLALVLLGLVYLFACDQLKLPLAGLVACFLLMTTGEMEWMVRSVAHLGLDLSEVRWKRAPFGISMLYGWYNIAPLAIGVAAWYSFLRHRESRRTGDLAASILFFAAMAFFHPIYYGGFIASFCLWLAWLWLREGPRPAWLFFLATPIPFIVLYKLPYYGASMPPQLVHPVLAPTAMLGQAWFFLMSKGLVLVLGGAGLIAAGGAAGPLPWLAGTELACRIFLKAPNWHWFDDPMYIALSLGAGIAMVRIRERSRRAAMAVAVVAILTGSLGLLFNARAALSVSHTFSPGEIAAGRWLRENTSPDDLIAILPNSTSSYTVLGLGERRLVHGWTGHLKDFDADVGRQESEVLEIFTSADPNRAESLASRYHVSYLYVGAEERARLAPAGLSPRCFPRVFSEEDVEIRSFACAASTL